MSDSSSAADAPHAGFDRAVFQRFNRVTGGFWRGPGARVAWVWTLGLAAFLVLKLFVDVGVNAWNRWFFDALEHHDASDAGRAALAFAEGDNKSCIALLEPLAHEVVRIGGSGAQRV